MKIKTIYKNLQMRGLVSLNGEGRALEQYSPICKLEQGDLAELNNKNVKYQLLIGGPGSGKTSLFLRKLYEYGNNEESEKILVLPIIVTAIEVGDNLRVAVEKSLRILSRNYISISEEDMNLLFKQENITFVIDGFEESTLKTDGLVGRNDKGFFEEIRASDTYKMLITARPGTEMKIKEYFKDLHEYRIGDGAYDYKSIIKNYSGLDHGKKEKITELIENNPNIQEICESMPMYTIMLCEIYEVCYARESGAGSSEAKGEFDQSKQKLISQIKQDLKFLISQEEVEKPNTQLEHFHIHKFYQCYVNCLFARTIEKYEKKSLKLYDDGKIKNAFKDISILFKKTAYYILKNERLDFCENDIKIFQDLANSYHKGYSIHVENGFNVFMQLFFPTGLFKLSENVQDARNPEKYEDTNIELDANDNFSFIHKSFLEFFGSGYFLDALSYGVEGLEKAGFDASLFKDASEAKSVIDFFASHRYDPGFFEIFKFASAKTSHLIKDIEYTDGAKDILSERFMEVMGSNMEGVIETSADDKIITFMHLFSVDKFCKTAKAQEVKLLNYQLAMNLVDEAICENLAKWKQYILETGYFSRKVLDKLMNMNFGGENAGEQIAAVKLFEKAISRLDGSWSEQMSKLLQKLQNVLSSDGNFTLKKVILLKMPQIAESIYKIGVKKDAGQECPLSSTIESIIKLNSTGDELYIRHAAFESLKKVLDVAKHYVFYTKAISYIEDNLKECQGRLKEDKYPEYAFQHQVRESVRTLMHFIKSSYCADASRAQLKEIIKNYEPKLEFLLEIDHDDFLKNLCYQDEEISKIYKAEYDNAVFIRERLCHEQTEGGDLERIKELYKNPKLCVSSIDLICEMLKQKVWITEPALETIRDSLKDATKIESGFEIREIVFKFAQEILSFDALRTTEFNENFGKFVWLLKNSRDEVEKAFGQNIAERLVDFFGDVVSQKIDAAEDVNGVVGYVKEKFENLLVIEKYLTHHPKASAILEKIKSSEIRDEDGKSGWEQVVRSNECQEFDREFGAKALVLKEVIRGTLNAEEIEQIKIGISFLGYRKQHITEFASKTVLEFLASERFALLPVISKLELLGRIIDYTNVIYRDSKALYSLVKEKLESIIKAVDGNIKADIIAGINNYIFKKFDHDKYKTKLFTEVCIDLADCYLDFGNTEIGTRKVAAEFVKCSVQYGINIRVMDCYKKGVREVKGGQVVSVKYPKYPSPDDREEKIYFFIEGEKAKKILISDESGISRIIYNALKEIRDGGSKYGISKSEVDLITQPVSCVPYFERMFFDSASTDVLLYSLVSPDQELMPDIRMISIINAKYVIFERRGIFGTYIADKISDKAIESIEIHPRDVSLVVDHWVLGRVDTKEVKSFIIPRGAFGTIPQRIEKKIEAKISNLEEFIKAVKVEWEFEGIGENNIAELGLLLGRWKQVAHLGGKSVQKQLQIIKFLDLKFCASLCKENYEVLKVEQSYMVHYVLDLMQLLKRASIGLDPSMQVEQIKDEDIKENIWKINRVCKKYIWRKDSIKLDDNVELFVYSKEGVCELREYTVGQCLMLLRKYCKNFILNKLKAQEIKVDHINESDYKGYSAIHRAIDLGDEELIRSLLRVEGKDQEYNGILRRDTLHLIRESKLNLSFDFDDQYESINFTDELKIDTFYKSLAVRNPEKFSEVFSILHNDSIYYNAFIEKFNLEYKIINNASCEMLKRGAWDTVKFFLAGWSTYVVKSIVQDGFKNEDTVYNSVAIVALASWITVPKAVYDVFQSISFKVCYKGKYVERFGSSSQIRDQVIKYIPAIMNVYSLKVDDISIMASFLSFEISDFLLSKMTLCCSGQTAKWQANRDACKLLYSIAMDLGYLNMPDETNGIEIAGKIVSELLKSGKYVIVKSDCNKETLEWKALDILEKAKKIENRWKTNAAAENLIVLKLKEYLKNTFATAEEISQEICEYTAYKLLASEYVINERWWLMRYAQIDEKILSSSGLYTKIVDFKSIFDQMDVRIIEQSMKIISSTLSDIQKQELGKVEILQFIEYIEKNLKRDVLLEEETIREVGTKLGRECISEEIGICTGYHELLLKDGWETTTERLIGECYQRENP